MASQNGQLLILEEELIKLILEFLSSRDYHVSLRTLERESNIINCDYSDEVLFLRELVLDGDFEEVLQFGASFTSNSAFDEKKFNYIVLRQKFIELIYTKCHILGMQNVNTVSDVMKTLSQLEKYCTTKKEYNNLCWLLTLPDLNSHDDFQGWNLDTSRLNCFNELLDCLNVFMPLVKRQIGVNKTASGNRLLQLIVKGLYYETCSDYCQSTATEELPNSRIPIKNDILDCTLQNDFSSSLVSWIRSLPAEVFQFPFEANDVEVCYSKLNGRKTHYARENLNGAFDFKPEQTEQRTLTRQTSEPSRRDIVNLRGSKSKSFDLHAPNILSSSLPVSALRNVLHGSSYARGSDLVGARLQSSFTAGSRGLSKPIDKQFSNLNLQSPNVHPVLSSNAFDMNPVAIEKTSVAAEQKPATNSSGLSNENNSFYRSSLEFSKQEPIQYGLPKDDIVIRQSFEDFKTSLDKNEQGKGLRNAALQQKSSIEIPKALSAMDELTKPQVESHVETNTSDIHQFPSNETENILMSVEDGIRNFDNENGNMKAKKSAIAFELFEDKPPEKAEDEKKRREEVFNKLKKHEQNRQESLKTILTDTSPESISSRPPLSSSLHSDDPSIYSSNEILHTPGKSKVVKTDRLSPTLKHKNHFKTRPSDPMLRHHPKMEMFYAEDDPDVDSKENSSPSNKAHGPVINGVRRPPRPHKIGQKEDLDKSPQMKTSNRENISDNEQASFHETKRTQNVLTRSDSVMNYQPVSMLEDSQAIRSVCFHPSGKLHAIGANSKILRICATEVQPTSGGTVSSMPVVYEKQKYHRGSIYCMSWDPEGRCLATGSNDKTIKVLQFDPQTNSQIGKEVELNIHAGTVRDLAFVPHRNGYLISGGAGSGSVNITDINTEKVVGTFEGHSGNILTVYVGKIGELVATGGTDNTLRLWDLRSQRCIDVIVVGESSPASLSLSVGNKYVASGQEDGSILMYDINAGRTLHNIRLHKSDCRSIRFSPDSNYLMTSSYDATIAIMHMRTNIEYNPPKHYVIAQHLDKVIQCRWHPMENMLLSSSADRTAILWKTTDF